MFKGRLDQKKYTYVLGYFRNELSYSKINL